MYYSPKFLKVAGYIADTLRSYKPGDPIEAHRVKYFLDNSDPYISAPNPEDGLYDEYAYPRLDVMQDKWSEKKLPYLENKATAKLRKQRTAKLLASIRWTPKDAKKFMDLMETPNQELYPDGWDELPDGIRNLRPVRNQTLLRLALEKYPDFKKRFEAEKAELLKDEKARKRYADEVDTPSAEAYNYLENTRWYPYSVSSGNYPVFKGEDGKNYTHEWNENFGRRGQKIVPSPNPYFNKQEHPWLGLLGSGDDRPLAETGRSGHLF